MAAKRDPVLDMVRGIGIVLVVVGHSGSPWDDFIYLFHMALFFMLSGYLFKGCDSPAALGRFAWRRVVTLWLPFVAANTAFTVLQNLFLKLNILTTDPRIAELPGNLAQDPVTLKDIIGRTVHWCLLDGGTQLGGALWFVKVLFLLSVLYGTVEFLLRGVLRLQNTLLPQGVVALAALALGWVCQRAGWSVWSLDLVASCYPLFYLGVLLRRLARPLPRWGYAVQAALGFCALLVLGRLGGVGLAANAYTNPAFLLAASLAGWALVQGAAALLAALPPTRAVLCALGRATMPVVILHFLAFKPVTWLGLLATGGASYLLAAFPVYFTGGVWWLAYTAAGLALPYALHCAVRNARRKLIKL